MQLIKGNLVHFTVGIDVASSGASNADRFALVVIRTDRHGSTVEHATARRGMRPTFSSSSTEKILSALDEQATEIERSSRSKVAITVGIDRTGDSGTAEMIEEMIYGRKWRHVIKVRRVWVYGGDGENGPDRSDRTDPRGTKWSVGRDLLIHGLAKRLRTEELRADDASGDAAAILREELAGLSPETFGTKGGKRIDHKAGKHDDVAMAAMLADWVARSRKQGGYTRVGAAMRTMAQSLTGDSFQPVKSIPSKGPKPKVWSHAMLIQVVRDEGLDVRRANSLPAAVLMQRVNAALRAQNKPALLGTVEGMTQPAPVPSHIAAAFRPTSSSAAYGRRLG